MRDAIYKNVLLVGLTIVVLHAASAAAIQCPQKIKTNQSLQEKINGWDAFVDDWNAVHPLTHVTFYCHHPKEHASLAPDNEGTKGNKFIWTFDRNEFWIACGYAGTTIQLIQKLPGQTKTCTVTYDDSNLVNSINCTS
ncbi:Uncharacterised protein [Legionella lansingensis]|uniref:Uncharacterized protein n=1 Tax=Legionella lansingensis TaxID=45067 RepID=A0A0W0VZJ9_9GAMM|nr:STY0301 family protein [Legionella lansingensis]KTD25394.1 hypothetical protein Llan_0140 [Legionella lansingensis]SNV51346.1 Uncharacterised protein [Legionella lansingensis]